MINSKICTGCGICCFINPCIGKEVPENPNYKWLLENKDKVITIGDQYWFAQPTTPSRCPMLEGEIGNCKCKIYNNRPPFCIDYPRDEGDINACNSLRRKYNLKEITIEEFKGGE